MKVGILITLTVGNLLGSRVSTIPFPGQNPPVVLTKALAGRRNLLRWKG